MVVFKLSFSLAGRHLGKYTRLNETIRKYDEVKHFQTNTIALE